MHDASLGQKPSENTYIGLADEAKVLVVDVFVSYPFPLHPFLVMLAPFHLRPQASVISLYRDPHLPESLVLRCHPLSGRASFEEASFSLGFKAAFELA